MRQRRGDRVHIAYPGGSIGHSGEATEAPKGKSFARTVENLHQQDGQGSVPTPAILSELPCLVREITGGTFDIDARVVPLAQVETAWGDAAADQRIVITP